jgi:hypothetical protein
MQTGQIRHGGDQADLSGSSEDHRTIEPETRWLQEEPLGVIEPRPRVQFPALFFDPHTDLRLVGTKENQIVTAIDNQGAGNRVPPISNRYT